MADSYTISFALDISNARDKVLIEWLKELRARKQNTSEAIRDTLHRGLGGPGISLTDIKAQLDVIETLLRNGVVVAQADTSNAPDPDTKQQEAEAKLDAMPF